MSNPTPNSNTQPANTTITLQKIGLMGRAGKPSVIASIVQIHKQIKQLGLSPVMDDETHALLERQALDAQIVARDDMGQHCDLVIVVGGDGSILHAGRVLANSDVPVIGVNRGRLGFLADVNPDEVYSKLKKVLKGEFKIDKRFLLQMQVLEQGGEVAHDAIALNDVVLHAGKSVHMIDFEMVIDGQYVYRQHSDGLIAATPTGSTAYALSGGGPILHPSMDAIVIVPLNPHTLSSRPIVVGGTSVIDIHIHDDNRMQPMVSADGQTSMALKHGQYLRIHKHPAKLHLLHPPGYDFYAACRTKLGWNARKENED